jgi:aspartyl-tRNA(Asn)/glutamyl-tRNA(Gln) amidotransferase subunit C
MGDSGTARGESGAEILAATARLARLDLAPDEAVALARDLERILGAFRALAAVDVAGVEPYFAPVAHEDVLRDDTVRPSLARDEVLRNAPRRSGEFIAVPKTVGGEP